MSIQIYRVVLKIICQLDHSKPIVTHYRANIAASTAKEAERLLELRYRRQRQQETIETLCVREIC